MSESTTAKPSTPRTQASRVQVRRLPDRGAYDPATIHAILDEGFLCHVGFVHGGSPFVIPTGYARVGDQLLIHGSSASRMMRALSPSSESTAEACITVTLVDGLVLARSAFNHSMNYRSVVILARGTKIDEPEAKMQALEHITERLVPGRWKDVRWPSEKERKATTVLSFPLTEASAKTRTGGPHDEEEDYALNIWAGVLPMVLTPAQPIPDDKNLPGLEVPSYIQNYKRS
jgi:nitroimidazol reductase NimA-like FMN-containing flavoprotein (pyridoxamine 5'-phosphate oxidase superfamily)